MRGTVRPTAARGAAAALCAAAMALSACGGGSTGSGAGTATRPSTAASVVPTPSTGSPSTGSVIPEVGMSEDLPGGLGPDASAPVVPESVLVTMLAERLTDTGAGGVETVVCDGDLQPAGSASVTCTATMNSDGRTDEDVWSAYAAHSAHGAPTVLWLAGDPLAPEFLTLLASPTTAVTVATVDPAYSGPTVDAPTLLADAQRLLREAGSGVALDQCEGKLDVTSFEPVICTGSDGGAPRRALVLPGRIMGGSSGLVVVTQPL